MAEVHWQRVREVFDAAVRAKPDERQHCIIQACGDDKKLLAEVESLFSSLGEADEFLELPAIAQVAEIIEANRPKLEKGMRFGRYEIIEQIGAGGMGEVYLAQDLKLDRRIAIKTLNQEFNRDESNLKRFMREAKAASALNHPNILVIHEIGENEDAHYIVSEFIEGRTLREIHTQSQMSFSEILDVSIQIADALSAAHEAHLIHRDIKPENVMVRPDGYVKVLDFGLAKLVEQKNKPLLNPGASTVRQGQTGKGVILGTVNYMSPQQAKGEELDQRTDIFSLGVVIYEMIAGKTPFAGDTMSETFANLINTEPHPFSVIASNVPDEFLTILSRTLRKNKDERYQTMRDLLTDLKGLRGDRTWAERLGRSHSSEVVLTTVEHDTRGAANTQTVKAQYSLSQKIRQYKLLASLILATLFIGAVGLGYYFFHAGKTAPRAADKKSIAVLPLKPINIENRDPLYEIGIADALIYRLSSISGITVRSLMATRKYADLTQDPLAAGREQQVDYVLASNYQLATGKIRITWQLFNVANGQVEDTHKTENDIGDFFAIQDAVASEVENILLVQFITSSSSLRAKRRTTNEDAYRLYLQGMYLANKRSPAEVQKGIEALEQAVRLDPNYAVAWAGLAYARRPVSHGGNTHEAYQKSIEAINKALALDENLADAYSSLCENQMYYEYDFDRAEQTCKQAIELDPDSSQAHDIYSRYLTSRGRFEQAIAEVKAAIDLEPTSLYSQRNLGLALFFARRYSESVMQLKRVIAMDKNFDTAHFWLSTALGLQGKESEAFEWFMKLLSLRRVDEETIQAYQKAFQVSGWQGVLRERAIRFEKGGEGDIDGAAYNAQIGNKNKAFDYLENVYKKRSLWIVYFQVDPRLDALHDDPRFDELVQRVSRGKHILPTQHSIAK